jgi:hypothetical protein
MDISDLLNSAMGQSIVQSLAGQLGPDEKEASGEKDSAILLIRFKIDQVV